ncbi:MAG TPA: DUF1622 domain-containing protein [Rubrobacteraceae bacterium]|nr:DUF1622 domain-containing protein [Rubrobacteraceae bacterium]
MDLYYSAVDVLRTSLLLAGSVVLFLGILRAGLEALRDRSGQRVPRYIMAHAALGLEFFVGATILNLILSPTWAAIQTTALTIVLRKLITLSLSRSSRSGV